VRQTCLVSYDITAPRRLRRMYRALSKVAAPIQYSVFLGVFTDDGLRRLERLIEDLIDPRVDDVRVYPLPENVWMRRLGRASLPAGILLTLLPPGFREPSAAPALPEAQPVEGPQVRPVPRMGRRAARQAARVRTGQRRGLVIL